MLTKLPIPILQAPMLGVSTPALAAAVSNAGGMGSIAIGALSANKIAPLVHELHQLTSRPFGINLFVIRRFNVDAKAIELAGKRLAPWRERFSLPPLTPPDDWFADFDAQLDAVIAARPAVASFTFGCLTPGEVARLHDAQIYVIGTATTPDEARQWQAVGADAVCLQGGEAGGHRGSFTPDAQRAPVPIVDLLRDAREIASLPLIAAGGIMTGSDIRKFIAAGAAAVQLGTAFLRCPEAATSAPWRAALAGEAPTRLTRAFSGRYARGIVNAFMEDMADIEAALPDYPVQNILTTDLRAACANAGSPDCLSLWAGVNYAQAREMPAAVLLETLWQEACLG
jgi:nitronate monooxygenase